jgi:serine/threonine protein kinase
MRTNVQGKRFPIKGLALTTAVQPFEQNSRGKLEEDLNRFLGMSLLDGHVTSVGQQLGQWVEWRPFLFESIPANFRHGRFIIEGRSGNETLKITGELPLYPQSLYDYALDHVDAYGRLDARVYFSLPRQAIGELIVRVATKVAECHTQGRIHGDLKTGNIILLPDGPTLIDAFDLEIGGMSPGWTPDWSAPEQILGEPVTMATDVYPLGRMVSLLLGGLLVGEVRKFKTRPIMGGRDEFDIFYDPFVYLEPGNGVINEKGCNKWLQFARSCLRFNPDKRISSAEVFAQYMRDLLESHPLLGEIALSLPSNLVAATVPDGTDTVARLIKDVPHGVIYSSGAYPAPPPSHVW